MSKFTEKHTEAEDEKYQEEFGDRTGDLHRGSWHITIRTQHSSGDKIRLGHITSVGKGNLRGVLTEAAWTLIKKDGVMAAKYERIKARAGGKKAIVAVAHNLLLRIRRILLDGVPYSPGVVG